MRRVRGGERRCGLATDGRRSITTMSAFRILRIEFFHENLTEHELDASEVNLGTNINTHSTIALEAASLAWRDFRAQKIKASVLETGIG